MTHFSCSSHVPGVPPDKEHSSPTFSHFTSTFDVVSEVVVDDVEDVVDVEELVSIVVD